MGLTRRRHGTTVDWPTVEQVEKCDDVTRVLRWNRFLPLAETPAQRAVIVAVYHRLSVLRAVDSKAFTAASKAVGW
jgi:hypothetical protein